MRPGIVGAALRASLFLIATCLLLLAFLLLWPLGPVPRHAVRRCWCRSICLLLGVRVRRQGLVASGFPTLYVANHVSYIDILVLGGFLDATFIAKTEVAGWPLLGWLARLAGTLFIRRRRMEAKRQRDLIAGRMRRGESFVLFPEGTSSDGLAVLPVKTSLLSVAEPWVLDRPVAVQPITLTYLRLADGSPVGPDNADLYAWHGEMDFLPHLLRILTLPGIEIEVVLDLPVLSWSIADRKRLGPALHAGFDHRLRRARATVAAAEPDLAGEAVYRVP